MKKLTKVGSITKVLSAFLSLVMILNSAPVTFAAEMLQNIQENNGPVISVDDQLEKEAVKPSPVPSGAVFSPEDLSPLSVSTISLPTAVNPVKTPLEKNDPILKRAKENLGNAVVSGVKGDYGLDNPTIYEFFDAQGKQMGKYIKGGLLNADEWRSSRALNTKEIKEVKSILGVQASSVELIRREGGSLLISIFRDTENNVVGQKEIQSALDASKPVRKQTTWSDAEGKMVQIQKVLADGTVYTMTGDHRLIQVDQDYYPYAMADNPGPRYHLVVNFTNGIASQANLQKYTSDGTLLQSETYNDLSLLNSRTSFCPVAGDGPCHMMIADYVMPKGELIHSFNTVTEENGRIVTRTFSLWGVISKIDFVKEHKIQTYKNGALIQVQIHLDPDPEPFICPPDMACLTVAQISSPYKTFLTVNLSGGKPSTASISRTVRATGKLDFMKTFENLEAFQTSLSECPENPFSGAPCTLQNIGYLLAPGFEKARIGNFSITSRSNGFVKVAQFDLYGFVKRITEPGTTQDFVNGKLSQLVQASADGKTKITVSYKEGKAVSAAVQILESGKAVKTLFYNPAAAIETASSECPDNQGIGAPCSLKQNTVMAPGGHFVKAGSFSLRTVSGGMITTKFFDLFGVQTETRFADGTRMLFGDLTIQGVNARAVTSMTIVAGGRKVQVTLDHATFQRTADPDVVKAAVLDLLKGFPQTKKLLFIKIQSYQDSPDKVGLCPAWRDDGLSTCTEIYQLELAADNQVKYTYEATVVTQTVPDSKIISVSQKLPA